MLALRTELFRNSAAATRRFASDTRSRLVPFRFDNRDCADPHSRIAFVRSDAHRSSRRCTGARESEQWNAFLKSLVGDRTDLPISIRRRLPPDAQLEPKFQPWGR